MLPSQPTARAAKWKTLCHKAKDGARSAPGIFENFPRAQGARRGSTGDFNQSRAKRAEKFLGFSYITRCQTRFYGLRAARKWVITVILFYVVFSKTCVLIFQQSIHCQSNVYSSNALNSLSMKLCRPKGGENFECRLLPCDIGFWYDIAFQPTNRARKPTSDGNIYINCGCPYCQ